MSVDRAAIITAVADRLGRPDVEVEPAVDAAIAYIADDTGVDIDDLPADDIRLNAFGVPLLAARIFQDSPLPSGQISEYDPTFSAPTVPRLLYSHLEEYWRHLNVSWGIA